LLLSPTYVIRSSPKVVRHAGNQQRVPYPEQNVTCVAHIYPSGPIRAGQPAKLEIEEIWKSCDRQPSLPGLSGATITKVQFSLYQVSFVPQQKGSLDFTFQGANGSATPYTYRYKADPAPIVAILLEVVVLCPVIALLIVLVRREIRTAKEELCKRAEAAAPQAPTEVKAAESPAKNNPLSGVLEPVWLEFTVETLTRYGKLVASVTAVVYLAGIFVVNAYLSQWGASDYSLLKPRALLAGLWFLLFLALCIFPMRMLFGKIFFKPQSPRENDGTVWFLLTGVGIGILSLVGFLFALCFSAIPLTLFLGLIFMDKQGRGTLSMGETLHVVSLIVGAQFFGAMISQTALQLVRRASGKAKKEELGQAAITALQLVGFLLFFAFMFARTIYWKIPDAFGGGGVHKEFITFKDLDDQTSAILQKGPNCVSTTNGTYGVAFSGDSYILLACPKSGQIFRLDRKYIVAESWPKE
jgi:hypothetical protein